MDRICKKMEAQGIKDDTEITYIDTDMYNTEIIEIGINKVHIV